MEHVLCQLGAQPLRCSRRPSEKVYRFSDIYFLIVRQVRIAESDWQKMFSMETIIPCMKSLKNTTSIQLTAEEIRDNDEDVVKPIGAAWIKKYHHFTYEEKGVLNCKYIRGEGAYKREKMKQVKGTNTT